MSYYEQPYPHLFQPITLRGKTIRNRIVSAPHGGGPNLYRSCGDSNFSNFTETAAMYYGAIARGGAAIVNTGHLGVDPRVYMSLNNDHFNFRQLPTTHDHQLPVMHMMTDLIHAYGALASIELNHGGRQCMPIEGNSVAGAYDHIQEDGPYCGVKVRGIDEDEMNQIADQFAEAAFLGKRGGFDIINVHAGHSWLLSQFFSPLENMRNDKYGGCAENRARFPLMVMKRIRERVGKDTILAMRFSANEMVEGGITLDDTITILKLFEGVVDIIQCSAGKINNITSDVYMFPMNYMQHGCNAYLAKEVRKHVKNVLIETVGGINEPEMADQFIADGTADLIGMARTFIADPNWAEKARLGKAEDIRPCIRCLRCMNYCYPPYNRGTSECTVNPRRVIPHPLPASEMESVPFHSKKVAVIGGGPAGMMAARELAQKGHIIDLYEKSPSLGGRLFYADYLPFKQDIQRYNHYLQTQVRKSDRIQLHLNCTATPEMLVEQNYEAIVIALGAENFVPNIPGIEDGHICHACDVFGHEDELGQRVAIIGGGSVGCELAVYLQTKGKQIDVLSRSAELIPNGKDLPKERYLTIFYMEHDYTPENRILSQIPKSDRVKSHLQVSYNKIVKEGIWITNADGSQELIRADTIILATGYLPNQEQCDSFVGCAPTVLKIGDCNQVADLWNTSKGGYYAALQI